MNSKTPRSPTRSLLSEFHRSGQTQSEIDDVLSQIRSSSVYALLRRSVKDEIFKTRQLAQKDYASVCDVVLRQRERLARIDNAVHVVRSDRNRSQASRCPTCKPSVEPSSSAKLEPIARWDEPVSSVATARQSWSMFVRNQLVEISRAQNLPLLRRRTEATEAERMVREDRLLDMEDENLDPQFETEGLDVYVDKSSDSEPDEPLTASQTAPSAVLPPLPYVPPARTSALPSGPAAPVPSAKAFQPVLAGPPPKWTAVYTARNLYDAIVGSTHNSHQSASVPKCGVMNLMVDTPSLASLQRTFSRLAPEYRQTGLDDYFPEHRWYSEQRIKDGERIAHEQHVSDASAFVRQGCPPSVRAQLWRTLTNSWDDAFRVDSEVEALVAHHHVKRSLTPRVVGSSGSHLKSTTVGSSSSSSARDSTNAAALQDVIRMTQQSFSSTPVNTLCTDAECNYYAELLRDVERHELLADDLMRMDVLSVMNSDMFFVFDELVEQVLLAFLRDPWVAGHLSIAPHDLFRCKFSSSSSVDDLSSTTVYPCCGVIPFYHFSLYASPFLYLYADPRDAYFAFRNVYARHFCHLHAVSSHPQSLPALCVLFEQLLLKRSPQLFFHLVKIGLQPLSIAFRWIVYAFSDVVDMDQVLLLWDRIIGFDSLFVLPVLAVGIFVFRRKALLSAGSAEDAIAVLKDNSRIKVVPTMQNVLFNDEV